MREVRISPDGNAVAIRSDADADAWNAWGVFDIPNGGHWSASGDDVASFGAVTEAAVTAAIKAAAKAADKPDPDPVTA